jgi:hypothetical protein
MCSLGGRLRVSPRQPSRHGPRRDRVEQPISLMTMPIRLLVLAAFIAACSGSPVTVASPATTVAPPTVAATTTSPVASPVPTTSPAPTAPVAIDSCGTVAKVIADGAQMVVDVVADGVTTQYNLQYQFAYPKDSAASQSVLIRAAQNTTQLLLLRGRQVAPDTGLPNTIQLRDYMVTKVGACPLTASIQPTPNAFMLPPGCGYVGSPTVGTDYSAWKFDCGEGANHDARGAIAYSLAQQGWTGCGVGLGSATWMKGDLRLIVSEGSGVPGTNGLPTLTQPARPGGTACG